MNPKSIAMLAVASLVAACSGSKPDGASADAAPRVFRSAPPGDTLLVVNGEAVTEQLLEAFARSRGLDPTDPEQRHQAQDFLVESLLVAQDALAAGAQQRDDIKIALDLSRMQLLAARHIAETRAQLALGEAELRAFYDDAMAKNGDVEFHLRGVLFADRAKAQAVADAVAGTDFAALIEQAGNDGALQAGDMGWLPAGRLPAELVAATQQIKDGETTPPVQTRFGWHVVQRLESRPYVPTPFEQVKEQVRKQASDQALEQKLKGLRDKAVIVAPDAKPAAK